MEEPDGEATPGADQGRAGPGSSAPPERARRRAPAPVRQEVERVVGGAQARRAEERLMNAAKAFERERYGDVVRMLRPLADRSPELAAARELMGLALYRQGRWAPAARHLEAYRQLSDSVDQHPVLADCYRGLKRWRRVDELWEELRAASPSAELVAEGRIVAAGARADRGDMAAAIALLARGAEPKRPRPHHLRVWYALGDLYERAGDLPRARQLFGRVVAAQRDFADAAERLAALG